MTLSYFSDQLCVIKDIQITKVNKAIENHDLDTIKQCLTKLEWVSNLMQFIIDNKDNINHSNVMENSDLRILFNGKTA